jgi:uncharacterized protein YndB with AHSA1/START domain
MWTKPEHMKNWWGPNNYSAPVVKMDVRVGGRFTFCMRGPDSPDVWVAGVFTKLNPPDQVAWTIWFADASGHRVSATAYGMGADVPEEMHDSFTFEPIDGGKRTKLTLTRDTPADVSTRYGEVEGWNQSLDRLAAELCNVGSR